MLNILRNQSSKNIEVLSKGWKKIQFSAHGVISVKRIPTSNNTVC